MIQVQMKKLHAKIFETEPYHHFYEKKKQLFSTLIETGAEFMPGSKQLLEQLVSHGPFTRQLLAHASIVTQSPRNAVDALLASGKCEILSKIGNRLTQEDFEFAKPHPEPYLTAMRVFTMKTGEPVVKLLGFEDSPRGFMSLKSAAHEWCNKGNLGHFFLVFLEVTEYDEILKDDPNWMGMSQLLTPLDEHQEIIRVKNIGDFLERYPIL